MHPLTMPRGIRNNNPGNIRRGKTVWKDQKPLQDDSAFVSFIDATSGLRALMKTLLTYHMKYTLDTVESIINRWAPPHENPTDHYAHNVARLLKVQRQDRLDLTSKPLLVLLAKAIVWQENGQPGEPLPAFWYGDDLYSLAADRALRSLQPA